MNDPGNKVPDLDSDLKMIKEFQEKYQELLKEIHKVIIGQDEIIEKLLLALFARGHTLIVGVPGLAKTLLVRTLADALGWDFKRIQFTPDMMPSDITGTEILQSDPETSQRQMKFVKGPIFANLILADEINRTPPKTQAALLEAMQEFTVTAAGRTYELEQPFFVAATQNPIEHEGTYPLPEAQLDRFMFNIEISYPSRDDEIEMVDETTTTLETHIPINAVFSREEVIKYQQLVRRIPVSKHVLAYASDLARGSRPENGNSFVQTYVEWGAGPRASQYLVLGAKSLAMIRGLPAPSCKEIREVARVVFRHRIIPNYNATGNNISVEQIINTLIHDVKEPDYAGKPHKVVKEAAKEENPVKNKISRFLNKNKISKLPADD